MVRALQMNSAESTAELVDRDLPALQDGDVRVQVDWSGVNYKDAMIVTGLRGFMREFPRVTGIDLAGVVVESRDPAWHVGDRFMINGRGLSEHLDGGFTDETVVAGHLGTRVPEVFSLREAAAIGTAGFTAALSVRALERYGIGEGPILVTGPTGGVGSIAIALLAARGYTVTAATGRPEHADLLRRLGATDVIDRSALTPTKPLQSERWGGAVDVTGGEVLAGILTQLQYNTAVAASGRAAGPDLTASMMPFILRNVALLGVNSVLADDQAREESWQILAESLDRALLAELVTEVALEDVVDVAQGLLAGQRVGRAVVRLSGGDA